MIMLVHVNCDSGLRDVNVNLNATSSSFIANMAQLVSLLS